VYIDYKDQVRDLVFGAWRRKVVFGELYPNIRQVAVLERSRSSMYHGSILAHFMEVAARNREKLEAWFRRGRQDDFEVLFVANPQVIGEV